MGLDTGAQLTSLDADAFASVFASATCAYQYVTVHGTQTGQLTRTSIAAFGASADGIAVGSVRIDDLATLSTALGVPVRGILGATWLAAYTAELHGSATTVEVTEGDAAAAAAARREVEVAQGLPETLV